MQVLGSFATSVMLPLVHNDSADVDAMAIAKKMSSRISRGLGHIEQDARNQSTSRAN
jgi:hypothetical protein